LLGSDEGCIDGAAAGWTKGFDEGTVLGLLEVDGLELGWTEGL
jgi:hypothetical protein